MLTAEQFKAIQQRNRHAFFEDEFDSICNIIEKTLDSGKTTFEIVINCAKLASKYFIQRPLKITSPHDPEYPDYVKIPADIRQKEIEHIIQKKTNELTVELLNDIAEFCLKYGWQFCIQKFDQEKFIDKNNADIVKFDCFLKG